MMHPKKTCLPLQSGGREKRWPYEEYYFGEKDDEGRKNGQAEQHWTGAESLEWFIGTMLHDTMHGDGDYRWRYKDPDGSFVTYEGRFFANQMHGYGMMSYPDGRVFTGLYYKDNRWGPGVERHLLKSNVGFWRGSRLARLSWRPAGPTVAPNLAGGPQFNFDLELYRIVLWRNIKIIDESNAALDILKACGANPLEASKKWKKLYPKFCTDVNSELFNKDIFDYKYYGKKMITLSEDGQEKLEKTIGEVDENKMSLDEKEDDEPPCYLSWNNSDMLLHMMKHCYMHDKQRAKIGLNLQDMLSGYRKKFRPASAHELHCRSLLLASFNGDIYNVTQLVNEKDIYPDVADSQGNTALMYATCGDNTDVIHFLVEAGATVNSYNDSCCTPLGVALLRYLCVAKDISRSAFLPAILPPKQAKVAIGPQKNSAVEWQIMRDTAQDTLPILQTDIKITVSTQIDTKSKSSISTPSISRPKTGTSQRNLSSGSKQHKQENLGTTVYDSDDEMILCTEKKLFLYIDGEYRSKLAKQMAPQKIIAGAPVSTPYLFTVCDIVKDIDGTQEALQASKIEMTGSNKHDKITKNKSKQSFIIKPRTQSKFKQIKEEIEIDEKDDKVKLETLSKIELTINQLLSDGADPTLVKCPQPAILLAMKSGYLDIVKHMVSYGVNVDEKFPEMHDYTVLDMVISEQFSPDNLAMISTLLELGADTCHRLKIEDSTQDPDQKPGLTEGPTLLHAVVMKKHCHYQFEEEIRRKEIQLLLQHNADPTAQYKGQSPIDCAMHKDLNLLDPFIKHPGTNLNCIINNHHHTILVKLFSREFFRTNLSIDKTHILTNLLLYGADPLIQCYDKDVHYENLFEFAQKTLNEMQISAPSNSVSPGTLADGKIEKNKNQTKVKANKPKRASKVKLSSLTEEGKKKDKMSESDTYGVTLSLAQDCTRVLYIRWLQGTLVKELVNVIDRYKHRHWTMIIKEHKNAHRISIWVNTARCLEIWDVLKTSHDRKYRDENILKKLLQIIHFYQKRTQMNLKITPNMTAVEKTEIEKEVGLMMRDHKIGRILTETEAWHRPYVKPELFRGTHKKFLICYECCLPLLCLPPEEKRIVCDFCGLVSFCNLSCLTNNIKQISAHPCSEKLKDLYITPFDYDSELKPPTLTTY
ncbi:hypothetical protein O0L34_g9837 [Tuta absoluta]|nr:hypothetical protein O0L34_g9837 [Tuta absoluta]